MPNFGMDSNVVYKPLEVEKTCLLGNYMDS